MMRFFLASLICFCAGALPAQPIASTSKPKTGDATVPVTAGQFAVALNGPWKFHIGDDPRWTRPDIDDSTWEQYDLAPGIENLTPERALHLEELPGWQHHGHPGYAGYAWYRLRLKIEPNSQSLALLMPLYVQNAYEVYLNSHLIGNFGKLDGFQRSYLSQPQLFPLPDGLIKAGQSNTLAVRFWNNPWEGLPRRPNLYGGLRGLPLIGSYDLLMVFKESVGFYDQIPLILLVSLNGAVGLISIFLFFSSGRKREYLWSGVALCSWAIMLRCSVLIETPQIQVSYQSAITLTLATYMVGVFAMPLAAMYLLGVPRKAWKRANYLFSFLLLIQGVVTLGIILGFLPPNELVARLDALLKITPGVFACLLVLIAIDGVRTLGRRAWLLMSPGILFGLYDVFMALTDPDFVRLPAGTVLFFTGAYIYCSFGVAPSVLVIFLLRFARQQRENGRLLEDMRQAREVQQLMIPDKLPEVPWIDVETEYHPALEVGGDFFQIVPVASDGSILIVIGDVAGHGLRAGMLVALLVGAITTEATHDPDPVRLLYALNQRLWTRGHSQATCLAIRIFPNGTATLANAGHLPPYLNGEELPMDGALPLGMVATPSFSTLEFDFIQSDQILLISDGVVEAQNDRGQLFGFERIRQLLASQRSARHLAATAAQFGQEDDITVLSITRTKSRQEALA
jgi:hypothetical protein